VPKAEENSIDVDWLNEWKLWRYFPN
jgi:hypothetical protein